MHEFSIAQSIIESAAAEAARAGAVRVTRITCRIGPLRQINDWVLSEAFLIARENTPCADARLDIERAAMELKCLSCNREFSRETLEFDCESCRVPAQILRGGDELELLSIEAEVDDPPDGQEPT